MATIRILLGIICFAAFSWGTEPGSGVLDGRWKRWDGRWKREDGRWERENGRWRMEEGRRELAARNTIVDIARSQLGVREATGSNDGVEVEGFLKMTKLPKGNPWCAAFISWVFAKGGFDQPRTAWSPALFPLSRQTVTPKPADVLGIYSSSLKRISHCGLVERSLNNWIIAIEGNTNVAGGREGDGVYRKWRHRKTIAKFADWVDR